jgi:short-subunit dehydrogenase
MAHNQSRRVFLTGASSGIGLETAKLLAMRGYEVWGTSRDVSRLPNLPGFHPVRMDLARADSIRHDFAAALKEARAFDVLINNAGAGAFGPLEALSAEMVHEQFQVLVNAPLELIRLALPLMRAQGRGTIINITSLAALLPIPFMAPYNAAKAAFSSFTQELRLELENTPIRVVEVRPGDIKTAFHNATKKVDAAVRLEDQQRMHAAWETQLRNMTGAPPPAIVAKTILRVIEDPHPSPITTVGGFFQARVATLVARLLPLRLLEWGLRRYYRI